MRVRDLWLDSRRRKTARHPDRGGNRAARRWLACWIGPDGREKTKAFRTRDEAARYAKRMEADVERGEYIEAGSGSTLFGAVAQKWLSLRQVGASTSRRYESAYRLHVAPAFAGRQIKSIRPSEVLQWLQNLAETHGTATQGTSYLIVAGVFDLAVADGMRRDNPAKSHIIRPPAPDTAERAIWGTERVSAVIDAHPMAYRAIPVLGAGCGLRAGEAFGIAVEDFDFAAGKVNIRRQVTRIGSRAVFKLPKGGKERTAPLSPGVASYVQAHIAAWPAQRYELPWMSETGKLAEGPHGCSLLVRWAGDDPRSHGRHVVASSFDQSVWKPALASVGVIGPASKDKGGIWRYQGGTRHDGLHMLRHWYTSCLLDAGVSLSGVMEFLGHSRKGKPVTLGTYGHVTEETFAAAREAIDRALFRLRAVRSEDPSGGTVTELAAGQ